LSNIPDRKRTLVRLSLGCLAIWSMQSVHAQVDLSGSYSNSVDQEAQTAVEGPNFVDYAGIPITEQARAGALNYTPETIDELQRQCHPYSLHYLMQAAWGFRMWPTVDPETGATVAWNMTGAIDRHPTTIWMDGRSPPSPQALATPAGFTTGTWQGNTLVTTTRHMQDGLLTRNGIPVSDQETLTMFMTRQGPLLLITAVIRDPVNLAAPYVLSTVFKADASRPMDFVLGATSPSTCMPGETVQSVLNGNVPSYLTPEDNPSLMGMTTTYNIPHAAALGGPQTMYPEYARQIAAEYQPPKGYCQQFCGGTPRGPGRGGPPTPPSTNGDAAAVPPGKP